MKLKKRGECPVCGSGKIVPFKKGTFNPEQVAGGDFKITDSHYGSVWNFSRCKNCTFVFSNPYIPEDRIIEFYSGLEDHEYSQEAGGRAKNFSTILKTLERLDKPGQTLLDVGAASGIFLDLAKQAGYKVQGIEPSGFLVEEAERLFGLQLVEGTIDDFTTTESFSVIALLDIIEHLVEPGAFLSKIDALIEEKGILVIVTPDIDSLAAKLAGKRWWHYRVAHINFFNIKSLSYLLAGHGYEIVKKKRYAWNFSMHYLITRVFPFLKEKRGLQKTLKSINLKLQLFDSWEIYARKKQM